MAAFLMAAGSAAFAMFSGLIASWFLSPAGEKTDTDIRELKAMVADLQRRPPTPYVAEQRKSTTQPSGAQ